MAKEIKKSHERTGENKTLEGERQEKIIRLSILEQDAKQIEQQLIILEQQTAELQELNLSLDDIKQAREKGEMLASLGKNIFVRTSLLSKELLVNVGSKILVKKSIPETKEIIEKDMERLSRIRQDLSRHLERIISEIQAAV